MRRIQREISTSRLSWPIAALLTLIFWFIAWLEDHTSVSAFVLLMATGLLMMWINHLFALIKVFSRMIASSYLAFTTALIITPDIGNLQLRAVFVQLCLVSFLILFFSCYQYRKAQGIILYAFLMIGIASLFFKQILFFVPLFWVLTGYCMVTMSAKILLSSIFGIILPYVFVVPYYLIRGLPFAEQTLLLNWEFCKVFDFSEISPFLLVSFMSATMLSLVGIFHLLSDGHKDKVRIRMMYQIFIFISLLAFLLGLLQPTHLAEYTAIQLISVSAMVGHFYAMTNTKYTNYTFITITAATYLLTIFNLTQ